jgi:regulatory protein
MSGPETAMSGPETAMTESERPAAPEQGRDLLGEEDRRYRAAFDRALRLLGQREHSVRELTAKLTAKGVDAATAGLVVDDLRGRDLQSDARFTEAFVHSRLGRGQGPLRIRQELASRGIDDAEIEAWLDRPAEEWRALAAEAQERKFGGRAPASRDDWNRQARFLSQKGFPSDVVMGVLGDVES